MSAISNEDPADGKKGRCYPDRYFIAHKLFFFLFFSANGALMPYLALFFKQVGMTATMIGIIIGSKPYVSLVFTPLWALFVDRTGWERNIFIMSLTAYGLSYFSFGIVPYQVNCRENVNGNGSTIDRTTAVHQHARRSFIEHTPAVFYQFPDVQGASTHGLHLQSNETFASNDQSSSFLSTNYRFYLYLGLAMAGTVLSSPMISLVDHATVQALKKSNKAHLYGRQRLWGSIGWGITSFGMGVLLTRFPRCPGINSEIDYSPTFYIFLIITSAALFVGLALDFPSSTSSSSSNVLQSPHRFSILRPLLVVLSDYTLVTYLLSALYGGVSMGFIRTFLFWFLSDIGGDQWLFALVSLIGCASDIVIYTASPWIIRQYGYGLMLFSGIMVYALRLLGYSLVRQPWAVVMMESFSGISNAGMWASLVSFFGVKSSAGSEVTSQGLLHAVHWGLGHGFGELFGGILVSTLGMRTTCVIFGSAGFAIAMCVLLAILRQKRLAALLQNSETGPVTSTTTQQPCCPP